MASPRDTRNDEPREWRRLARDLARWRVALVGAVVSLTIAIVVCMQGWRVGRWRLHSDYWQYACGVERAVSFEDFCRERHLEPTWVGPWSWEDEGCSLWPWRP